MKIWKREVCHSFHPSRFSAGDQWRPRQTDGQTVGASRQGKVPQHWPEDTHARTVAVRSGLDPDGWLAAVGLAASSLSAAISPAHHCFPHSSSEVDSRGFPTPPQQQPGRSLHWAAFTVGD